MQENINIGGVVVPIIKEGDEKWYPISYIIEKVLLKKTSASTIVKQTENTEGLVKKKEIDYSFIYQARQSTYCINELGLKIMLEKSKIGRLSVDQRKSMNDLLKYLGMKQINTDERFINKLSNNEIKKYNIFIQDCINEVLKENPEIKFQKCTKCNKYYPYHNNFFRVNVHSSYELTTICKNCNQWSANRSKDRISHTDKELTKTFYEYGEKVYLIYRNHETIKIYEHFIKEKMKFVPKIIHNKDNYLIIIKYLHDNNKINIIDLNIKEIERESKLTSFNHVVKANELYEYLFGNEPKEFPWRYPNFPLKNNITYDDAKIIIQNYLNENKIKIDDVYEFDYTPIICNSKLAAFANGDYLKLIMHYHDYQYAPYKFKGGYSNYWKNKENRIDAMKFLIEKDLNIEIDKIPLYLTKYIIMKNARTLYGILSDKRYYGGKLYKWINECYANQFIETDFNINVIRNEFDSMEEAQIHDYLSERFGKNLIYNQREGNSGININGMMPDWILFINEQCYLIEYFGLYVKINKSKRVFDYIKKANVKMNKYKKLKYLKSLFLFPEDLDDDMKNLKSKVDELVS